MSNARVRKRRRRRARHMAARMKWAFTQLYTMVRRGGGCDADAVFWGRQAMYECRWPSKGSRA